MHSFIISVISSLIKLLWVFSSSSKKKGSSEVKPDNAISTSSTSVILDNLKVDEKTAEIIQEVTKLDTFLTNVQEAKSYEERLDLLIEFEEDEKMRELLVKMRDG
jgi:hypothetical protein